ncbi:prepilin-type N-terminal cleavage/methylation domain-containing protein [Planctomycetota bacterium]
MTKARTHGFSLVELLVVIAIIMLLVALLMPIITSVRIRAKTAVCISNLRQIGVGLQAFTGDHKGQLPGNYFGPIPTWYCEVYENILKTPQTGSIFPYVLEVKVYLCPLDRSGNGRLSYSSPTVLRNKPYGQLEKPAEVMYLLHESAEYHMNNGHLEGGFSNTDKPSTVHGGEGTVLYCDWHASVRTFLPSFMAKNILAEPYGWND